MGCVSDGGYISAGAAQSSAIITQATINAAIQVAVALWQRNASQSISNIQTNLADQQVELAEAVQAHAAAFWPAETALIGDIFGIAKTTPTYDGLPAVFDDIATDALTTGRQEWIDVMRAACMAPSRPEDTRWQRNSNAARADLMSYGDRQDEDRAQILNDRRYAYQLAVLGLGRGATAQLVSYQSVGNYSLLQAGGILEAGINTALVAYGYYNPPNTRPDGWSAGIQNTFKIGMPKISAVTNKPPPEPVQIAQPDSIGGASSFTLGRQPVGIQ